MTFLIGDRVKWTYRHWLNRKSFTYITKEGTLVGSTTKGKVKVHFEGNKYPSRIKLEQLERCTYR